jgi:hypothetical protein
MRLIDLDIWLALIVCKIAYMLHIGYGLSAHTTGIVTLN